MVSVQKALWSATGAFVGVVRVALESDRLDELARVRRRRRAAQATTTSSFSAIAPGD